MARGELWGAPANVCCGVFGRVAGDSSVLFRCHLRATGNVRLEFGAGRRFAVVTVLGTKLGAAQRRCRGLARVLRGLASCWNWFVPTQRYLSKGTFLGFFVSRRPCDRLRRIFRDDLPRIIGGRFLRRWPRIRRLLWSRGARGIIRRRSLESASAATTRAMDGRIDCVRTSIWSMASAGATSGLPEMARTHSFLHFTSVRRNRRIVL